MEFPFTIQKVDRVMELYDAIISSLGPNNNQYTLEDITEIGRDEVWVCRYHGFEVKYWNSPD